MTKLTSDNVAKHLNLRAVNTSGNLTAFVTEVAAPVVPGADSVAFVAGLNTGRYSLALSDFSGMTLDRMYWEGKQVIDPAARIDFTIFPEMVSNKAYTNLLQVIYTCHVPKPVVPSGLGGIDWSIPINTPKIGKLVLTIRFERENENNRVIFGDVSGVTLNQK